MLQTQAPPSNGHKSWVRPDTASEETGFLPTLSLDIVSTVYCTNVYLSMVHGSKYVSLSLPELFTDVCETEEMANSVKDSDGVCFVPSFSGLQVCYWFYSVWTLLSCQGITVIILSFLSFASTDDFCVPAFVL